MIKKLIGTKAFYKKVMLLVIPIMLQNGITNLVSMVDNIMVGTIGTEQMTAVAIVNQLLFVFNLAIFGTVSGIGIFTAQFYGKGDSDGIRQTVRLKIVITNIILTISIIIFILFGSLLINSYLHEGSEPMNLELAFKKAKEYLYIMLIGLFPFVITQVYGSTFREVEKPIIPMISSIMAVAVNLVFNYLLIFGKFGFPCLGIEGAAIATVLSRFVECIITVSVCHIKQKSYNFIKNLYKCFIIKGELIKKILPKALPLLANEVCWSLGIALLNNSYSVRGLDVVAATNITSTISNVFMVSIIAFGSAISIIVGGLLGAGKIDEAIDTNRKMTFLSFTISLGIMIALIITAPFFPLIYNTSDSVRKLASIFMICYAIYLPFNSLMNSSYFAIRSGGDTAITLILDSGYMLLITVPFTFILARFTNISIIPLYALSLAIEIFKVAFGLYLINKGSWAKNIVSDKS